MRKKIFFAALLPFFLLVHLCLTAVAGQKILEDITFESLSGSRERITFKLDGPNIPKIFAIKGENPRVVFDFIDTKAARVLKNTINTNGKFIKRIRLGFHTQPVRKTRVVFDLTTDREVNFDHDFNADTNSLIITAFQQQETPEPAVSEPQNLTSTAPAGSSQPSQAEQSTPITALTPPPKKTEPVHSPGAEKSVDQTTQQGISQPVAEVGVEKTTENVAVSPSGTAENENTQAEAKKQKEEIVQPETVPPEKNKTFQKTEPTTDTTAVKNKKVEEKITPPPAVQQPEATGQTSAAGSSAPLPVLPDDFALLREVTFDGSSNRGEMVLFKVSTFHPPVVFGKESGHPQVICEFKQTTAEQQVPAIIEADGKYVHKIRISNKKAVDKVQAVIDLAPGSNYDLQQVYFKEDNLFVIIVNPLSGKENE